jgi:N-acetylmuramoyl-L-alanine amidase
MPADVPFRRLLDKDGRRKRLVELSLRATAGALLASMLLALTADAAFAGSVTVQGGQNLTSIAALTHTTVSALAAANGITNPNLVYAGSVLNIPSSPSAGSVLVEPGETLTGVAAANGTTVDALAQANDMTDLNLIYAGEVLVLPGGSGGTPSLSSSTSAAPSSVTVSPGQTLTSIAANYGTTVSTLAAVNQIANANLIFAGTSLVLPSSSNPPTTPSAPATDNQSGLPPQLLANPSRFALEPDFIQAASTYGVPASLLEALCWWESGWQTGVVSSTGAIGVCQIEPGTGSFVNNVLYPGQNLDVYSAAGNIDIGAALLHDLLLQTNDDSSLAVAGYYQGLLSVEQQGMLPTTSNYVTGILRYSSVFAASGAAG